MWRTEDRGLGEERAEVAGAAHVRKEEEFLSNAARLAISYGSRE